METELTYEKNSLLKGIHILNFQAMLVVTRDMLEARLIPVKNLLRPHLWLELHNILNKTPIKYGILKRPEIKENYWVIARGLPPIKGQAPKIRFIRPKNNPELPEDVSNLVNTNKIICYEKDEIIAEKYIEKPNLPGISVFGEEIWLEDPIWSGFPVGKGVRISEDDCLLIADISGILEVKKKYISITEHFRLLGSVGHETGNIVFRGKSLEIIGGIDNGFNINTHGDLTIYGKVENAGISVKGNLTVNGVISGENTKIFVDGNFNSNIIEQASVEVKGDMTADNYLMDSDCLVNGSLTLKSNKGLILGGTTTVGKTLIAKKLGGAMSTPTFIYGGFLNVYVEKYNTIRADYEENVKKLELVKKGLDKFQELKKKYTLADKHYEIAEKLTNCFVNLVNELKESREKITEIENLIKNVNDPEIILLDKAYPGVSITINNVSMKLNDEMSKTKFKFFGGEIFMGKINK